MEKLNELLSKYEIEYNRIRKKSVYKRKPLDLSYMEGLIHGVKGCIKILNTSEKTEQSEVNNT